MRQKGELLIGKYRLIRSIGKGGMGEIYAAEHEQIGKQVAVKFLHQELAANPKNVERLTREARAAAAVGHKSIIDIYDIGTTPDGIVFLVMELLEGESLRQVLKREGRLGVPVASYIVCQVLSALDAAHAKGIIHRDLKPDNVFLLRTRQPFPDVKLLDFGISKVLDGRCTEDRLTKTGDVVGTPYYMAPEQAKADASVDRRADIYSMGAILYECLTGQVPFTSENVVELVYKLLNARIVPPIDLRPELPEEVSAIAMRALARVPSERFSRAADMLCALLPHAGDQAALLVSLPDVGEGGAEDIVERAHEVRQEFPATGAALADTGLAWAEEPPRTVGRWRRPVAIGGTAVLAVALVALAVHLWPESGARRIARSDPSGADAPEMQHPSSASKNLVSITLQGVPEGATIFLEGAQVDSTVLRLPRSPVLLEVRVEDLDGRRWRRMVSFEEDRAYDVVFRSDGDATGGTDAAPDAGRGEASRSGDSQPSRTKARRLEGVEEAQRPPGLAPDTQFPRSPSVRETP